MKFKRGQLVQSIKNPEFQAKILGPAPEPGTVLVSTGEWDSYQRHVVKEEELEPLQVPAPKISYGPLILMGIGVFLLFLSWARY